MLMINNEMFNKFKEICKEKNIKYSVKIRELMEKYIEENTKKEAK